MQELPDISVIIPTWRRPQLLRRCLHALLQQDFSGRAEIIVADDEPGEQAYGICRQLSGRGRFEIRYVEVNGPHGPAAARNAGAAVAGGGILAFTDDDCVPAQEWLSAGSAAFSDAGLAALTGRVLVPLEARPTDYQRNEAGLATAEFVTANLFCRRSVFFLAGRFDTSFTSAWREDSDLHFRLLRGGYRIGHSEQALVYHPVRPAHWGVSILQQKKARFEALLFKKHPVLYRQKIGSFPLHYYGMVAGFISGSGALLCGFHAAGVALLLLWLALAGRFAAQRLRGTARSASHVTEMICTSLLIPFLSVYWRLNGALKYGVWFL